MFYFPRRWEFGATTRELATPCSFGAPPRAVSPRPTFSGQPSTRARGIFLASFSDFNQTSVAKPEDLIFYSWKLVLEVKVLGSLLLHCIFALWCTVLAFTKKHRSLIQQRIIESMYVNFSKMISTIFRRARPIFPSWEGLLAPVGIQPPLWARRPLLHAAAEENKRFTPVSIS